MQQYDLVCVNDSKIGAVGSAYFIGWALLALVIPRYANVNGRKPIYGLSLLFAVLAITSVLFCTNIDMLVGASFVMGLCCAGRITVGFCYAMEFLQPKHRLPYAVS